MRDPIPPQPFAPERAVTPELAREESPAASTLRARIDERRAVVAILGLGYVGLPLARLADERGFRVLGYDNDEGRIAGLEAGEAPFRGFDRERFAAAREAGRFRLTADPAELATADILLICVPTPLHADRTPDLGAVDAAAEALSPHLRAGQLVILESTTYPGTTEERLRAVLDRSGLALGTDYFLAYSPERQDLGNRAHPLSSIPKVVGGVDAISGDLAERFYAALVSRVVRVGSARAAEATKLLENVFRAVNIALVNELKVVYDRLDIDIWEVLDAAATKPFGFQRFDPGPGWGGHCIPLDPFYLGWIARQKGVAARFVELAGEVNVRMPAWVIEKLEAALAERGRALAGSRVLVVGLAYKRDVDDTRESPAFEILQLLLDRGADVGYHDPHVPRAPHAPSWPRLPALVSQELTPEALAACDAVVLVTDHSGIDYEELLARAPLLVDTRGVYRRPHPRLVKA